MENNVAPSTQTDQNKPNHKKIIWIILTVIALGLVAYALVQKYGKNKMSPEEEYRNAIYERLNSGAKKDVIRDPEFDNAIYERLNSGAKKDVIRDPEFDNAIYERLNSNN